MPSRDGTGPVGQGPYRGRNQEAKQGFGRRGFRNFGFGNRICDPSIQSKESLIQEKNCLEKRIEEIESQLSSK